MQNCVFKNFIFSYNVYIVLTMIIMLSVARLFFLLLEFHARINIIVLSLFYHSYHYAIMVALSLFISIYLKGEQLALSTSKPFK